jgi:hypothetical protein
MGSARRFTSLWIGTTARVRYAVVSRSVWSRGTAREALLTSDINIRENRENGKPEVLNQRREWNAETRARVRFTRCEPNAPGKQASGVVGLRAMQTF